MSGLVSVHMASWSNDDMSVCMVVAHILHHGSCRAVY